MKTEREKQQRDALEALDELTRKAMGTLMDDRPEVPRLKETVRRALSELERLGRIVANGEPYPVQVAFEPRDDEAIVEAEQRAERYRMRLEALDPDRIEQQIRALSEPAVPEAVRRLPDRMREAAELESNQGRPGCAWLLTYWLGELDRTLAQHGEGRVPEGWKLVPVEPTDFQCIEGRQQLPTDEPFELFDLKAVYKAMLAAAPEPDGEKEGETNV